MTPRQAWAKAFENRDQLAQSRIAENSNSR
jgi:hypothetical protein